MKINYDPEADTLYIRFKEDRIEESDELKEGIILDYNKKGEIVAIEFLEAAKILSKKPEVSIDFPFIKKFGLIPKSYVHT